MLEHAHKAERGELRQGFPVGLARGPAGEVILNPDEEVQARIQLVFEKFRGIRSAGGVMRYLREAALAVASSPQRWPCAPRGRLATGDAPRPSSIFSTIPPTRAPMSMGASSLILHVARQRIHAEGGFGSPLTSGTFVCTIDIQRTLRGKNL